MPASPDHPVKVALFSCVPVNLVMCVRPSLACLHNKCSHRIVSFLSAKQDPGEPVCRLKHSPKSLINSAPQGSWKLAELMFQCGDIAFGAKYFILGRGQP